MLLAFGLLVAALLLLPMRAGVEDQLMLKPGTLKMNVGDSYTISCALSSDDMNQRLKFASSDTRVASIGNDGTVYALSSGEAVISAKASGGASAQMQVTVAGVPMSDLSLNVDELYIDKGEYSGLRVSYNSDASDTRLQWLSSDERVVRVDSSGRILGVGGGEAYVSVLAPNGRSASAKVYVDVEGMAVHISPYGLTLGVGARVPLKSSSLPEDSTDRVIRWVSSDSNVLAVDENGVLNATGVGEAYISVLTEDGLTTGMEVIVEPAPRDIQLDPSRATLERGDTLQMQLMFLNEDGSVDRDNDHLVVWSSSDSSVATVDQNGMVTALRSGSCKIEATSDGMIASCRLNVQVTIQEITLDQSEVYMLREETGKPIQLHWVINPVDADDPTVTFTSNNTQVANVSQNGLVTMTGGYGTAVITASAPSGASADFIVNVVTQLPPEETPEPVIESSLAEVAPADNWGGSDDNWGGSSDDNWGGSDGVWSGSDDDDETYSDEDLYYDIYGAGNIYDGSADDDIYTGDLYGEDVYEEDIYNSEFFEEDIYGDDGLYVGEDVYVDDDWGGSSTVG